MKTTIRTKFIIFILAGLLALAGCTGKVTSGDQALSLLSQRIQQDKLYQGRFTPECLSFSLEAQSTSGYDISVREVHGGSCAGDPNTAPLVDIFRVTPDGKILWQQPDGSYLPYDQAKAIIQKQ